MRTLRRGALTLLAGAFLAGCDGILDVDLPGQITQEGLLNPSSARIMANSAIADVECGFSDFLSAHPGGYEDTFMRVTGWFGSLEYTLRPGVGGCSAGTTTNGWWTPLHSGRFQAEQAYELISDWSQDQLPGNKDQMLAEMSIYAGFVRNLYGDYFCEASFEGGPLMSPQQTLQEAEQYMTQALSHIQAAGGDFEVANGIASSARQMALALRARIRWALGNSAGAMDDALQIEQGFQAYATRGPGIRQRWNRVVDAHNNQGWATITGPITWHAKVGNWTMAVVPFTGYRYLGILPDGRAVTETRHPITTQNSPEAVADTRVPVTYHGIYNGFDAYKQQKYPNLDSPMVMANWEEIWLIRAEIVGGQGAIDLVNEIRDYHGLPRVTYVAAGNAQQVKDMIIEERRRSLWLEGRYWATKLREDLWFPRAQGRTPYPYSYQGGVRMLMPANEYELNPNFTNADEGTLCNPAQRPV